MLNSELSHFARIIVRGEKPSSLIEHAYANYSGEVAIEVYRNNYRGNLHDALAGAYPVVKQLVGDDFFRLLARRFIEQHPSRSANLHDFGPELPGFVAAFEQARELVYLPDVAALEWACHVAYFAADETALDVNELAQVAPEQYSELVLRTRQSCHLLHSRYPVVSIWHAHQPGAAADFHIDLDSGTGNALVYREDGAVRVIELTNAETDCLHRVASGISLGEATVGTLEHHPKFDLQAALLKFVKHNVIAGFTLGATS
ncbi:MAG: putative DNA-binding domain-containing protein [Nitrosomonadales bacterium]|nr:putative DNA-binding domain-containing protein [Nitrosomonadales bacterium]